MYSRHTRTDRPGLIVRARVHPSASPEVPWLATLTRSATGESLLNLPDTQTEYLLAATNYDDARREVGDIAIRALEEA